jgi:hypothetical protein
MRGNVYFPEKVYFIRPYLLSFLVLFEFIPVNHLIAQIEMISRLLLCLLLLQLQVNVAIGKVLVSHLQSFVVFIMKYFL